MSIWKAALLGALIPTALVLPAVAQEGPREGPRMVFEQFDLDGDGSVTLEEMEGARAARFAEADANDDGVLDRDELIAMATERAARGIDRMLERVDADGDGAISSEEMADMRGARRGPGPEAMFERFDANADGAVTEAEFDEAMAAFRERHGGRFGDRGEMQGRGQDGGRGHGQGFWRDRG
ncbi:calcium-binding protein [Roseibacterium sp. SDUM158016]|uniref:EF-hand domain-containing protein n=1 Tax=Roseicyclus sediminis TaxID=2980997 RepID=UPI0021D06041|nr:calcium-binding protein [Roseibacterium sp. SDUM158016]MCU4654024.1 calcium-binding protein [Roseibacterium sp. SDUM158016]